MALSNNYKFELNNELNISKQDNFHFLNAIPFHTRLSNTHNRGVYTPHF